MTSEEGMPSQPFPVLPTGHFGYQLPLQPWGLALVPAKPTLGEAGDLHLHLQDKAQEKEATQQTGAKHMKA